jgi:hypothetical protein
MHAQAASNLAQSIETRREEAAEHSALAELFDPRPPAIGVAPEPLVLPCPLVLQDEEHLLVVLQ